VSSPPTLPGDVKLTSGEIFNGWSGTGTGGQLTFANIPYSSYEVLVVATTDNNSRIETIGVTPSGGSESFQSFTLQGGGGGYVKSNNPIVGWDGSNPATQPPVSEFPNANYVEFDGLTASSFTLEFGAPGNGAINGVQIINTAVPEPASIGLIGLASLTLLKRRRG
jgi:hypothetical protein